MSFLDITPDTNAIEVVTLPGLISRGLWRVRSLHARSSHAFFWFTRGQGRITIGGTTRGYGANTLVFVPSGAVHALTLEDITQGYGAYLPDSLPVPVPSEISLIKAGSIFDQAQMTRYFEEVSTEFTAMAQGSEQVIESYLTLLSVWIERHQHQNDWRAQPDPTASIKLAENFLLRLERNYKKGWAVADYAAELEVSPTHLTRVCQARLRKSASELVQERLILEAKLFLADSGDKISDIAKTLGFTSAAYFTRLFHKHTGISPRDFRKNTSSHR